MKKINLTNTRNYFFLLIVVGMMLSFPKMIHGEQADLSIEKIQSMPGYGNPASRWQLSVQETTDTQWIAQFTADLAKLTPIDKPNDHAEISATFKLIQSNGSALFWYAIQQNEQVFYRNGQTNQYFHAQNTNLQYLNTTLYSMKKPTSPFLKLGFLLVIIIIQLFISRKVKATALVHGEDQYYSTKWQYIVTLALIISLLGCFFADRTLHMMIPLSLIFCAMIIQLLLEHNYGKNKWRYVQFVAEFLYGVAITSFLYTQF